MAFLIPVSLEEVVDRYVILKLRKEHEVPFNEELFLVCEKIIQEQKPPQELVDKLYDIHRRMWPLHDQIMSFPEKEAGKLMKYILSLNGERRKLKNEFITYA